MKKKTEADMQVMAAAQGGTFLGPYVNTHTRTGWRCAQGHEWQATPGNVQQGHWCPHCAGLAPKTEADMHVLAAAKGGTFLGPYVNNYTKTGWRCAEGHEWMAIPNSIQQGTWCPVCAGKAPKTDEDMQVMAAAKGGTFLGPLVNTMTKTGWRCAQGHEWQATPGNVQQGTWCLVCAGKAPKTDEDMQALAASQGGTFLGPMKGMFKRASWRCAQGHEWQAVPISIQKGHWCPHCAGLAPKTEADMHVLAAAKGGTFLGPLVNTMTKTRWRCSKGHEWKAKPTHVRRGSWCPRCCNNGPSKGQLQVLEFVRLLLPGQVILCSDRTVLRNPRTGWHLELDIWIPALKTAIEYNGNYWHQRPKTQARDLLKQELCARQGIRLLTVWEQDWQDNHAFVERKIKETLCYGTTVAPILSRSPIA